MAAEPDATIDPRLFQDSPRTQPHAQPLSQASLPSRTLDTADYSEEEDDGGGGKRQKLNLWKCKQCRDARKKVALSLS